MEHSNALPRKAQIRPEQKLGPGVDYRGGWGASSSPCPRWPWALGQRNLILKHSADRSKCFMGFQSLGVPEFKS